MAIPGSGAISMSMFNTELGRAFNTANSSLAGGSTPAVGSLFWLANQSGSLNQTAPHSMSEWYGYTATPPVDVSIDIYTPGFMDCNTSYVFRAEASQAVNTDVTVTIRWDGDLTGQVTDTVTILNGETCGDVTINTGTNITCGGEFKTEAGITNISPGSSGSYTYIIGSSFDGNSVCL